MRPLYEIREDILALIDKVDPDTGEVLFDPEALDALMVERDEKIESVALAIKNIKAEGDAIAAEIKTLTDRKRVLDNKAESIKSYLKRQLDGEKFSSPRVAVSYRNASSVKIDELKFWDNHPADAFVRRTEEPNKKAISDALKNGVNIPGASLETNTSIIIK